ncbi:putative nuclear condensin complex subunit smc4 protein [Zalerion maritima]|uniref:Structural maintenance of chromosomes protein n=1 Tax=Zalerion maritima TaxID=339359 RepID=A0AAD5RNY8_9PEZI|nr:putative nuclear condensin complex subunit smc4 protein [Zalerion maritima]
MRRAVVESDGEDEVANVTVKLEVDENEAPDPATRKISAGRRKASTAAGSAAPAPRRGGRRTRNATPSAEQSIMEADETLKPTEEPAQKAPRTRRSGASRASVAPSEDVSEADTSNASVVTALPSATPEPAAGPLPQLQTPPQSTPLKDITNTTMGEDRNIADETQATVKPVNPMNALFDRPMDIVLKSRAMNLHNVFEEKPPAPRLVITYLILTNFKSYAGRQEVGPFHASFSSVVGPNGSGKSNVIDSLLFVFGFRASKMRQGKISALIHNSAQFPNLDNCEVAVHFHEPSGGSNVIPNTELVISRRAFKNNSSKYYINSKESNFTTVTTLLRERGIDLDHKRFLILQGEVESIAQMKPKAANEHDDGLLEYLEDIIGTSKYKTPIEETANEVETLNEICVEKSGRVQHVEKEKNSLEDKKTKALAFVRDENELAMKQAALYQLYIAECDDNLVVTQEAIAQMQAQLDSELEKHSGSEQVIKQLDKAFSTGNKQYAGMEKDVHALVKDMNKFEQERVKFEEKRKFLVDKRKKLEKTISNSEKTAAETDQTVEECNEEIETRTTEIEDLETRIGKEEAELATIRDSLKGKTQKFSDQIAIKQKSLEPWKDKINEKKSAIAVAESEMAILKEKANSGAVALQELQAKVGTIEEGREAKEEELKECEAKKTELEKKNKKVGAELQELAKQEPKGRNALSNARQKADEARSSLRQNQNRGNVLTALMRMKESGRIDGFHGRLGNLGTIDKQYDIAISTACPSLDNFVTDTVEAGQKCIEYLRKTNLGRGNFMCLDKLRQRDLSPIQTPENAPRLFDLVKAKEDRFKPAFYHALQDTLVAADLEQANRIAYGARRWRVVTLDGELIDKSGTMSGGGSSKKRGLMSSKLVSDTTEEVVDKLEGDRDALEKKFSEFQEYVRELETRLRQNKDEIPKLETKMQKIGLEIDAATRNLADTQRRIKDLEKEHQPSKTDDARIAALEKEVAKLNKEVEKLHDEMSSVEDEIKALQDKIMEAGGEKLRAQKAKVDAMKEEIASQHEETSNAEVRRAKAEKQKIKMERDHAKATRELDSSTKDLKNLEQDIENQGEKAESYQQRVEDAEEGLKEKKKELSEVKAELDGKTAELNETRAVEIEMRNKLEENQKILTDNQKKVHYWEEKLGKLVLQNVDDLLGEPTGGGKKGKGALKPGQTPAVDRDAEGDMDMDVTPTPVTRDENGEDVPMDDDEEEDEEEEEEEEDAPTPSELPRYTRDELGDMSKDTLKGEIAALEEKVQNAGGVDLGVLSEYRRRVEEHAARSSDLQSALKQRDTTKKRCDDLRRLRLEGFMEGFSIISLRLKEMYQMITMGGNAELELVDSLDPFSEGILFSVMPPKKSWKNISNLSGGEKTLSSLALVFALHHYKPTPLYVMDEIDAALDFRNVSIVANYIKERTKNGQFIVISLRNNMFELAARLVGVYKVNHMTKSVTIDNKDYIQRPGASKQQQQQLQQGANTTLAMR